MAKRTLFAWAMLALWTMPGCAIMNAPRKRPERFERLERLEPVDSACTFR
jgi:hypothetical protein